MIAKVNITEIDRIVSTYNGQPGALIRILQDIQQLYNYLPEDALRRISEVSDITPADISGVSTFYSQFRHQPAGKHTIKVCVGTACHVKGSERIVDAVRRHLKIDAPNDTDNEGLFTVTEVACLGCCTLAPAVQIDDVTYGHLTTATVSRMINDFLELQTQTPKKNADHTDQHDKYTGEIRVGLGSCCIAGGSAKVHHALEDAIEQNGAAARVKTVGCVGMCHQTPLVEIIQPGKEPALYSKVDPLSADSIVRQHFKSNNPLARVRSAVTNALDKILTDETWEPVTRSMLDVRDGPVCAFLGRQKHIAAEFCGQIGPLDIDEYINNDGFKALRSVIENDSPTDTIKTITDSGLRGRGGAGFSTGRKWAIVQSEESTPKYVVMNGDEGDPGAFMDRMLLESYPFRIIEGIIIAALTVGAEQAILYIRAEYPLAVSRMKEAIRLAGERGLLGKDILNSGHTVDFRIMEGAGAFVCGEETALLESLEGKRGMPRMRPPFPAKSGYQGQPTLINNVESYSCIPWIIRNGSSAFAELGTRNSRGTKVFSLTGKTRRGGLIEVPMGVSVGEIVEEIGGGVAEGRRFKAVQIGGPSGGCIPASLSATPIDYEALSSVGAIMGSGGLVILDDADCMVDIARYFLRFTQAESCGKCTFCRVGTKRMLEILDRLCTGQGKKDDIEQLETLAVSIKQGSLCGLGKTAPNPVLSTIRHFRDEYEAHIDGRCPAGKCSALIEYTISDKCNGCTKCAQNCPVDAIEMKPYEQHVIDINLCTRCDTCRQVCPVGAVEIISPATKAGQ